VDKRLTELVTLHVRRLKETRKHVYHGRLNREGEHAVQRVVEAVKMKWLDVQAAHEA